MRTILGRIFRIARASTPSPKELYEKFKGRKTADDTEYDEASWDEFFRSGSNTDDDFHSSGQGSGDSSYGSSGYGSGGCDSSGYGSYSGSGSSSGASSSRFPQEVKDDLALFNLTPPSSLAEVKKARNREIKKCHPDRFHNNPEKQNSAKKMMQIYNAAYDRMKKYYAEQGAA